MTIDPVKVLLDTYDRLKDDPEADIAEFAHMFAVPQIEIQIGIDGRIFSANKVQEDNGKKARIMIQVTEKSQSARTSGIAPHGLSDTLAYIARDFPDYMPTQDKRRTMEEKYSAYHTQLKNWAGNNPYVNAVLKCVETEEITKRLAEEGVLLLKDGKLQENGKINQKEYPKALVCFSVIDEDGVTHDTWEEKSVQTDWINYCVSGDVEKEAVVCEFTGKLAPAAVKHPKTLMRFAANAKLISSNDSNGMTYLGRFGTPDEACTISSEASYCFHSAVKWAEDRAVSFKKGKDKDVTDYMSWCMETPQTDLSNNDEQRGYAESQNQYYLQVQEALKGKLEKSTGKHLVFMTTGSVSPGHMAISGFRVGSAEEIFRNEAAWNKTSSFFTKGKNGETIVRAPSVGEIICYAFGTERKDLTGKYSMNVNEKIYARQLYILTQCVTENKAVPDLVLERLMRKASSIRNFCDYKNFAHSRFIVCALARKKMIEDKRLKEEDSMEFNLDTASIDMLFGALLAIYDKAERDFCDKHKVTNAQNLEPQYISQTADTLVKLRLAAKPYLDKARKSYGGCYLEQYICELMCKLGERLAENGMRMEDVEQLGPEYMIGFELMKKTLYSKKVNNNSQKKQE